MIKLKSACVFETCLKDVKVEECVFDTFLKDVKVEVSLREGAQLDGAVSAAWEESVVRVEVQLRHPLTQVLEQRRAGVFPRQVVDQVVHWQPPHLAHTSNLLSSLHNS